jgi:RimJ/RimL family protein N-acetyltransferase
MGGKSSGEREYALLVAELRALDQDIHAARAKSSSAIRGTGLHFHAHRGAAPPPSGEGVLLPDGAQIVIRPIEPADRDELAAGFEHLSAMSRMRRFGEAVEHLSSHQLTELTNVDHDSHEAMVALAVPSGEGIGVARFVRATEDPARAQFTCTVVDRWQGRGVGTALIERLAGRAQAIGVKRFSTVILVGNEPARRLLLHVARDVTEHREGGKVEIIGVPRDASP